MTIDNTKIIMLNSIFHNNMIKFNHLTDEWEISLNNFEGNLDKRDLDLLNKFVSFLNELSTLNKRKK